MRLPERRREAAAVALVVAGAALLRWWVLTTRALQLEADEAVTGIMARRILDGHHLAFYAGQDYMGTIEQYLQAAVLALLPDSPLTLRIVQVALAAVSCVLVHRVATACRLGPARAALAAALFAAGPYFLVYWGVKSRGGYAAAMVLSLIGLLLALRPLGDDRSRQVRALTFGVVIGFAFWTNQQAALVLAPAAWWQWAGLRERPARHAALLAAGFGLGALPALWHTASTGRTPFATGGGSSSLAERIEHLVSATIPDVLGVRDDGESLFPWLPPMSLVGVACLVGIVVLAVRRRRGLLAFAGLRGEDREPLDLLVAVLCSAPLLLLASGTSTTATARFAFVVYPVLAVLAASGVAVPRDRRRFLVAAPVLLLVAHTALGARWTIADDDGGHAVLTGAVVTEAALGDIVDVLRRSGSTSAYADYWLAQPLTWEADGDVLVEPIYQRRFPHVSAAVHRDPSPALVVSELELPQLSTVLERRGTEPEFHRVGRWVVLIGVPLDGALPEAPTVADALVAAR